MNISELYNLLSESFPKELSAAWDNDGIMLTSDMNTEVNKILIALDASEKIIEYASKNNFNTVITHHPMIFRGVKSISETSCTGRHILTAIKNGISVLSFHTRLDAADSGVNDTLCRMIGYEPISKFGDDEAPTLGRIAEVPPISAIDLAMKVKAKLECQAVRFTGDPTRMIRRIGFCGGDGKSFIYPAIENGCDAFITGDAGYNIATDAAEEGLITIEAGHFHTEFPVCVAIKDFIASFSDVKCEIYRDCPYHIV